METQADVSGCVWVNSPCKTGAGTRSLAILSQTLEKFVFLCVNTIPMRKRGSCQHQPDASARGSFNILGTLTVEQTLLELEPVIVASQTSIFTQDAMARYQKNDGITGAGAGDASNRIGLANAPGEL